MIAKTDAATLTNKVIKARTKYNDTLNSILDAATARRGTIGDAIVDLQTEDAELRKVQDEVNASR